MRCDWRIAIENALEDAHVNHIHKDSLAKLKLKLRDMGRVGKDSWATYDITDARSIKGLSAMSRYFKQSWPTMYAHYFEFPNTCISSVGGFTQSIQKYTALDDGTTALTTELYKGKLVAGAPDLSEFFDNAAKFNKQVFEEDARLCERIHIRGLTGEVQGPLQRLAWFTEALNDN